MSCAFLLQVGFDFIGLPLLSFQRPSIQFRIRSSINLVLPMLQWAWPLTPGRAPQLRGGAGVFPTGQSPVIEGEVHQQVLPGAEKRQTSWVIRSATGSMVKARAFADTHYRSAVGVVGVLMDQRNSGSPLRQAGVEVQDGVPVVLRPASAPASLDLAGLSAISAP